MKKITNKIIACFLLLCFSVTIVPLNFLHEHDHTEETHCDINDEIHSDNACHFSFFQSEFSESHCSHQAHITEYELDCEFCKILNSQRSSYAILKEDNKSIQQFFSVLVALQLEQHQQSFTGLVFNKGSPFLG